MKVGIINVTGYAGAELARILYQHPEVEIASVTGRSAAGQKLGDVFPHLSPLGLTITPDLEGSLDLVFSALPHKASAEAVIPVLEQGVKVVDISADFRLKQAAEYQMWYGVQHPAPSYLEEAVYGLTELHREDIRSARLVANPGCYPTSAILAMAPAVKLGLIEPDIIIDSKSGVSGAGRGLSLGAHFSEVNENVMAYALEGHRHLPEITQELGELAGKAPAVTFLTHLIPMTRGILSTCYAKLRDGAGGAKTSQRLQELYREFYADHPFVTVTGKPPQTKQTLGNNWCLLHPVVDTRTGRLIVISCIDNLVKGAAGQAVQNMNLMCGFPEDTALRALAVYP
ncbi:MAG: N-acetyl-gamma-glutamyl-phosphate reductase [Dehalococcoidia bacterium]|nr:N-acetyl-gamma-glutamyl-phosphate reductase [Dehalococcoidia bacterium]MSQ17199.1 N-acetyl-gamma-glutamyl-phosphate reductase [Dehalococcoidia bacterium]